MITTTFWKTGDAFDSFQGNSKIEIDAKAGFSPKALLLTGLAGCTGIDVVGIPEKTRVPFSNLKIEVETGQTTGHPRGFKDIHIHYIITADEGNANKIKKGIDLSWDQYCRVSTMLKKNSKIDYTLTIQSRTE